MATMFEQPKLLFLALPKTGTTFVHEAMRRAGVEMRSVGLSSHDIQTIHKEPRELLRFTIVRDTLPWLRSCYNWCCGRPSGIWTPLPGPASLLTAQPADSFEQFLARVRSMPRVTEYVERAYTDNADVVLNTEMLNDQLAALMKRRGVKSDHVLTMDPENVTATF